MESAAGSGPRRKGGRDDTLIDKQRKWRRKWTLFAVSLLPEGGWKARRKPPQNATDTSHSRFDRPPFAYLLMEQCWKTNSREYVSLAIAVSPRTLAKLYIFKVPVKMQRSQSEVVYMRHNQFKSFP
jgi:hypothetical protein